VEQDGGLVHLGVGVSKVRRALGKRQEGTEERRAGRCPAAGCG